MSIIEGIGDEVVFIVGGFLLVVFITLAWLSTYVGERPRPEVVVLDGNRITQMMRRLRSATSASLTHTPIGYIIRPRNRNTASRTADDSPQQNNTTNTSRNREEVSVLYANLVQNNVLRASTSSERQVPSLQEEPQSNDAPATEEASESSQNDPTVTTEPETSDTSDISSQDVLRKRRLQFLTQNNPQQTEENITNSSPHENTSNEHQENSSNDNQNSSQNTNQPTFSSEQNDIPESEVQDGHIRIRLKYLDERQRCVQARPDSTILQFKRLFFEGEMSDNVNVRLIYNGQELRGERTLQSYNVEDCSVIHCLISRASTPTTRNNVSPTFAFDMGTLVFPLFGFILILIWYCRFTYRSYFNAMSTFSLIGITFLFVVALMASFRTRDNHEHVN